MTTVQNLEIGAVHLSLKKLLDSIDQGSQTVFPFMKSAVPHRIYPLEKHVMGFQIY